MHWTHQKHLLMGLQNPLFNIQIEDFHYFTQAHNTLSPFNIPDHFEMVTQTVYHAHAKWFKL